MIINVKKTAKDLKIKSVDLITRPIGMKMFEYVRSRLDIMSDDETLLLDFDGIGVIDSSFIDEFIVNLMELSKNSKKAFYIKLKNISDIAEINIDSVFRSYSNYNRERLAVVTDDIRKNNSFYIGVFNPVEKNLFEYLRLNKMASIEDLSDFAGTSDEEIVPILDNLLSMRILKKIDGRYSHI